MSAVKRQVQFVSRAQQSFVTFNPKDDWGEILFCGGYGSGKSFSLGLWLLKYLSVPQTDVVIARKNAIDIRKSTWKAVTEVWDTPDGVRHDPLLPAQAIKSDDQVKGIVTLWNKSTVTFAGLADDQKIRSTNYHGGLIEECSELSYDMYLGFTPRIRRIHPMGNVVCAASNPTPKHHWMYKHFVLGHADGQVEHFMSPTTDNVKNLPKSYIERLARLPEKERDMYLYGKFVSLGDVVFYCFDSNTHVTDMPFVPDGYIIAQDFGGGAEMSAALLLAFKVDDRIGVRVHVCEEFTKYKTRHTDILEWQSQYRDLSDGLVVYDGANAALKNDMEADGWVCYKGIKNLAESFTTMNKMLSDGRLTVSPSCKVTVTQLEGAEYVKGTSVVRKEQGWDAIDACRYGACYLEAESSQGYEYFTNNQGDSCAEGCGFQTAAESGDTVETSSEEGLSGEDGDEGDFFSR